MPSSDDSAMPTSRLALLSLALLWACSSTTSVMCSDVAVPAVVVEPQDSLTGASLAQGARGAVQDGSFLDSLRTRNPTSLQAAFERPGTYTVTIVQPGYADWMRSDVQVQRGVCHVETVTIQARLQVSP